MYRTISDLGEFRTINTPDGVSGRMSGEVDAGIKELPVYFATSFVNGTY